MKPGMKEMKAGRMLPVSMYTPPPRLSLSPPTPARTHAHTHTHHPCPYIHLLYGAHSPWASLPQAWALALPILGPSGGALSRCGRTGGKDRGGGSRRPPEAKGMSLRARPKAPRPWLRQGEAGALRGKQRGSPPSCPNAAQRPGAPTAAIPSAPGARRPPGARASAGDSDLYWNLV